MGEVGFQIFAGDDGVEEAVFEEELGALEALGELLANGLLDNAGSCEANECARFGDVEVTEHGEAGGDAAGGGVGQDGDVRDASVVETGQSGGYLGQLHERGDAFHHAGSAGCGDDDERMAGGQRAVYSAGDGFADDGAHTAADEAVLHSGEDDGVRAEVSDCVDDGIVEASPLLGFGEAFFIGLEVGELERVSRFEFEVDELIAGFEEVFDAAAGVEAEVIAALGTDLEIGFEIGLEEDRAAGSA